jgi:hypothetical protein
MEKKVKSESSGRFELERNNEASDRKAQKFADVRRRLVAAAVLLDASKKGGLSDRQRRVVLDFAEGKDLALFPSDRENFEAIYKRKKD